MNTAKITKLHFQPSQAQYHSSSIALLLVCNVADILGSNCEQRVQRESLCGQSEYMDGCCFAVVDEYTVLFDFACIKTLPNCEQRVQSKSLCGRSDYVNGCCFAVVDECTVQFDFACIKTLPRYSSLE